MKYACRNLKLAALDIDGVLVKDTFSPVIRLFVEMHGGTYDAELEKNVFSRSRQYAATYLNNRLSLGLTADEVLEMYFNMRDTYIAEHGGGIAPGVGAFLQRLGNRGLEILCYGGLDYKHFAAELKDHICAFSGEKYICTNDFRPGVREIISRTGRQPHEVLFVDDVDFVAQHCKQLGAPFIGMPSTPIQRAAMRDTGVQWFASTLDDISDTMLMDIDLAINF
jgi:hypothetical protein